VAEIVIAAGSEDRRPGADPGLTAVGAGAVIAVVTGRVVGERHVRRAGGRHARAGLRDVAETRRRTTCGSGGDELIQRARVARTVAALGDVAITSRGPTDARDLLIGRAADAGPGAVLGHIADTGRRATLERGRLQAVRRAGDARAGAGLGHVARTGRGT